MSIITASQKSQPSKLSASDNQQNPMRNSYSATRTIESQMFLQELRGLEPGRSQALQTKLVLFFAEMERVTLVNNELARENLKLKEQYANLDENKLIEEHKKLIVKTNELQKQLDTYKNNISQIEKKVPSFQQLSNNDQSLLTIADLKSKINLLLDENSKLVEVAEESNKEMDEMRIRYDLAIQENQALRNIIDKKDKDVQLISDSFITLDQQHNELQKKHAELQMNHSELQKSHADNSRYHQNLHSAINSQQNLLTENQVLQNNISLLYNENEKLNHLLNEKNREHEEIKHEYNKRAAIPVEKLHELNNTNNSLADENEKLKVVVLGLNEDLEILKQKCQKIEAVNAEAQSLHINLAKLNSDNEKLLQEIKKLNGEVAKKTDENELLKKRINDFEEKLKTNSPESEKSKWSATGSSKEKRNLNEENTRLKMALDDCLTQIEMLNSTINDKEIKLANANKENQQMSDLLGDAAKKAETWKKKSDDLEKLMSECKGDYEAKIVNLLADIEKFVKIIQENNMEIEKLKNHLDAAQEAGSKVAFYTTENEKLLRMLADKQRENEILGQKCKDYDTQLKKLQESQHQQSKDTEKTATLKPGNETQSIENQKMNITIDQFIKKNLELDAIISKIVKENNDMKISILQLSSRLEKTEKNKEELEKTLNLQKQKIESINAENEELKKARQKGGIDELNALKKVKNDLESKLLLLTKENQKIKEELESFKNNISQSHSSEKNNTQSALDQTKAELAILEHKIDQIIKEKVALEDTIEQIKTENEGLKIAFNKSQSNIKDLSYKLDKSNSSNNEIKEIEEQLYILQEENRKLYGILDNKTKENDDIKMINKNLNEKLMKFTDDYDTLNQKMGQKSSEFEQEKNSIAHQEHNRNSIEHIKNSAGMNEKPHQHDQDNQSLIDKINKLDQENQRLANEKNLIEANLKEILVQNEALEKSSNLSQEWERRCIFLESENDKLSRDIEELLEDIRILNEKLASKDLELLQSEDLRSHIYILENDNIRLEQILIEIQRDLEHWKKRCIQLEIEKDEEIYHWKGQVSTLGNANTELLELQRNMDMAIVDNQRLKSILYEYQNEMDDLRKKLKKYETIIDDNIEHSQLKASFSEKNQGINQKNKKVETIDQEIKLFKKK